MVVASRSYRALPTTLLLLLLVSQWLGCAASLGVQQVRRLVPLPGVRGDIFPHAWLTESSQQVLKEFGTTGWALTPEQFQNLLQQTRQQPTLDRVFAICELCYRNARRRQLLQPQAALTDYINATAFAYYYLFDPSLPHSEPVDEPRQALVCQIYNRALTEAIRLAQQSEIALNSRHQVNFSTGCLDVQVEYHGFLWQPEDFDRFEIASDYQVQGFNNQHTRLGLGIPLIAFGERDRQAVGPARFYSPSRSFPVTAFFRMKTPLTELPTHHAPAAGDAVLGEAVLGFYDPLRIDTLTIGNAYFPIAADLTTPLGYLVPKSNLAMLARIGLFEPERVLRDAGIYMLEPYQPGKIPVVFIHGLWSSPRVWIQMFNDLRANPVLQHRYQFWFAYYPTGNPFLYSASLVRRELQAIRETFDPQQTDPAFDQMVLVGHSMGGLVSKLLVQNSGNAVWDSFARCPFDALKLEPCERDLLQSVFFFETQPYVRRVIFIATPHRGSNLADRLVGRLGSLLVSRPSHLEELRQRIVERNQSSHFVGSIQNQLPSSVDNLSPHNPILKLLDKIPIPPDVPYHSIIAKSEPFLPLEYSSDLVVPYRSSHLVGADSEHIVSGTHSCTEEEATIREVELLLLQHLNRIQDTSTKTGPVSLPIPELASPYTLRPIVFPSSNRSESQ